MLRALGLLARCGAQASASTQPSTAVCSSLLRHFAAEAQSGPQIPAGILTGVPGKYALALHGSATKANVAEKVEKELAEVIGMAQSSPEFAAFLKDPSLKASDKQASLKAVLAKADVCAITQNFVGLLVENRRMPLMGRIVEQYKDLMSHLRGEIKAVVTTAEPLGPEDVEEVRTGLQGLLKKGQFKSLLLEQKVDPAIIGGIILSVGDKHVDMSILSRVRKVQQLILENA